MLTRLAATLIVCLAGTSGAQTACSKAHPILVGSETERYLRLVQTLGGIDLQPWMLRPFSPAQASAMALRDSTLPAARLARSNARCLGRVEYSWLPAEAGMTYNSAFPLGYNDGAIWAGRGITSSIRFGFTARAGALSLTLAPIAFASQNSNFEITPNGQTGPRSFASWRYPDVIDIPQRFGSSPYGRLDPGQSELRLDALGLAIGLASTNQHWGPATHHPVILGDNAAGIPRLFFGTARPARLKRIGAIHGQLFWGRAGQSAYSPLADSGISRLVSGMVLLYQPEFLRGMEVGGARFFHVLQPRFTLDANEIARPFGSLLRLDFAKQSQAIAQGDNQLASLFMRFVAPGDGMEIYGEVGREDHANTLRELLLIPDHDLAYLIGMKKAWKSGQAITALHAEVLNSRVTHISLSSQQSPFYQHSAVSQGHTHHGQALGSVAAHGGGANLIALERYDARRRRSLAWERLEMGQNGIPLRPSDPAVSEVHNILSVEELRYHLRGTLGARVAFIYAINRLDQADSFALQVGFTTSRALQ